jgi:hypothetical protein
LKLIVTNRREQKLIIGSRPVVRAREGSMRGIRQPLDGAIFESLEDAEWCMHAMAVTSAVERLGD